MSARRHRSRARFGGALLALYPEPWRGRYREEMLALLEDDPPSPGGLASLLRGALEAHLRPGPGRVRATPRDRMRLSVCGLFGCWIALSVLGGGFAKETEAGQYSLAGHRQDVLTGLHEAVVLGALLGSVAIAVGGLPLLWQALVHARRHRDWRLAACLALPVGGVALFVLVTATLIAIGPGDLAVRSTATKLAVMLTWWASGLAAALACGLAPRLVLRRVEVSARSLRLASAAGTALALAMAIVSISIAAYDVALAALAPSLAGESGGPIWPSTGATLAVFAALALLCTALGGLAALRAGAGARLSRQA